MVLGNGMIPVRLPDAALETRVGGVAICSKVAAPGSRVCYGVSSGVSSARQLVCKTWASNLDGNNQLLRALSALASAL